MSGLPVPPNFATMCVVYSGTPPARSARREVRNPVLSLPAASRLLALPPESRAALAAVLADISRDAAIRADESWRKHKGPMAAYWRAVSVYSKHILRVLRRAE